MSANVPATLVAIGRSIRRAGSAFATDLQTRLLGNMYRTYTRVTGHVPTGFSADRGGHDHSGVGSGLPMPRNLGSTVRQVYAGRDSDRVVKLGAGQIAAVCLAPTGTASHLTGWFNLHDIDQLNGAVDLSFAPTFRRVKISPGINWVGAQIVAKIVTEVADYGDTDRNLPAGHIRLSSALSSTLPDDPDGAGDLYAAAYTGEAKALHAKGVIVFNTGANLTKIAGPAQRIWLGQPIRPQVGRPYASSLSGGDTAADGSLAQMMLGAVRVTPGVQNDLNIEFKAGRRQAFAFVYAIRLFEIDAPTGATYG